jgi:dihydroorotate dehydrogenase electron transfer subunit
VKRVRAEVLSTRRLGSFSTLTLVAPEIAEEANPGQFITVAMPEGRAFFLRRHFPIHQASRRGGWAGTLEFAFEPAGLGTAWLAAAEAHEFLDVIGPLGKGFDYPRSLTNCLLVADGRGAPGIYFLAQELRAVGKRVDLLVGAETQQRVFKPIEAKRLSQTLSMWTGDGTLGERGTVVDALGETVERCGSEVVYAAGPRPMLRAVAAYCAERGLPSQIALDERMACGVGLCFGCVVPVARKDGRAYDNLRACTDGPVFNPGRVLWDRWGAAAPAMTPTPPEGFPVVRSWPE